MPVALRRWFCLALVVTALACSGDPAGPELVSGEPITENQLATLGADSLSTLLSCKTSAVRAETKEIGPGGGELRMGSHRLVIPSGALAANTLITGGVVDTAVVAVELEPAGLRFLAPVALTLDYKDCVLPTGAGGLHLAYISFDGTPRVAEHLVAQDDRGNGNVTAVISHFSRYAVAW